jgi:serine/threonine protein kinase
LNPHKRSIKYGGSCDEFVKDGYTCKNTEDGTNKTLGRGSHGTVYLVEKGGVEYAMKIINFEMKYGKDIFDKEVILLKKVHGISNIVRCIEYWETKNHGIIIMNYLGDTNLDKVINLLTEEDIWKYITQLAITINELHKRNLFHNDIKGENIMIYSNNAYLIDLGLMTEGKSSCSGTYEFLPYNKRSCLRLAIRGCREYHCPKQHDIYSLAITMFNFINLKRTFRDRSIISDEGIISLLNSDKNYKFSKEYRDFIINIIDDTIQTAGDILSHSKISPLLPPILSQIIVKKVNELYRLEDEIKAGWFWSTGELKRIKNKIVGELTYCAERGSDDYTNYCEVMIDAFIYNELKSDDSFQQHRLYEIKESYTTQHKKEPDLVTMTQLIRMVVTQDELEAAHEKVKEKLLALNIPLSA